MTTEKTSSSIAIVGAGFSGLTLAWALLKQGFKVEVFESSSRAGGLIFSEKTDLILAESAANALLANLYVEQLFQDLNIKPIKAGFRSNKRWIFRNTPRRLPLSIFELGASLIRFFKIKITGQMPPLDEETIEQWGHRCFGKKLTEYLLTPALQGIYGVPANQLSAALVVGGLLNPSAKIPRGQLKGSISAEKGMYSLIEALVRHINLHGGAIHFNQSHTLAELKQRFAAVVVATSYQNASQLIQHEAPQAAKMLSQVPSVGLDVTVLGFEKSKSIRGFGCLFPQDQSFHSLGVLFNTDIFEGRGLLQSESWITQYKPILESELLEQVRADRVRLLGRSDEEIYRKITRWPKALPLYGFQLKKFLESGLLHNGARLSECTSKIYLTGNYLGTIGLAKILARNLNLAELLKKELSA